MDYKENIFDAISVIAKAEMEKLGFDITIVCTIKDAINAPNGEYYVTDGTSSFYAYSENTSYKNGESVYVTIPGGDYDNQKIIIGKHTSDDDDTSYVSPASNFVAKTKNLYFDNDIADSKSLIANYNLKEPIDNDEPRHSGKYLWSLNDTLDGYDYDTIYLKADFKSILGVDDENARRLISGDYGLQLHVVLLDETNKPYDYNINLNTKDMSGNVYDFETFYTQEKAYKIPNKNLYEKGLKVQSMELFFRQDGEFYKMNDELLPWYIDLGDHKKLVDSNLFVDNIEIKMGYEQEKISTDQIVIRPKMINAGYGTIGQNPNGLKYYSFIPDTERMRLKDIGWTDEGIENKYDEIILNYNEKIIELDTEKFYIDLVSRGIVSKDNITYKLYTYVNPENGYGVSDPIAGENWEEISFNNNEHYFIPNITKEKMQFKAIAYYQNPLGIEPVYDEYGELISPGTIDVYLHSDILEFTLVGEAKKVSAQKLTIRDEHDGIYKIYDLKGRLINSFDKDLKRYLHVEKTNSDVVVRNVTWIVPYRDTMIEPMSYEEFMTGYEYGNSGRGYVRNVEDGVIEFTMPTSQEKEFYYRIKEYLNPQDINNTIVCTTRFSNGSTEIAEKTLEFCTIQPHGTQFKIAANFYNGVAALAVGTQRRVKVRVLTSDNTDITENLIKKGYRFKLEWYSKPKKSMIEYSDEDYKVFDFLLGASDDIPGARITEVSEEYILSEDEIVRIVEDADSGLATRSMQNRARALADGDEEESVSAYEYAELRITDEDNTRHTHDDEPRVTETLTGYVPDFGEYFGSHIIKISILDYEGNNIEGYFPVPITMSNTYTHYIGPTEVRYDSSGANPAYYKDFPKLMYRDEETKLDVENTNVKWSLYFAETLKSTFPEYSLTKNGLLQAPPLYVSGRKCINMMAHSEDETQLWIQPIPIVRDLWDAPILNSWHDWTVHAIAAGAAKRLSNGNVSGVFLGEIPDTANYQYLIEKKEEANKEYSKYSAELQSAKTELKNLEEGGGSAADIAAQKERVAYLSEVVDGCNENLEYINALIDNVNSTIGLYGMYDGKTFFNLTENGELKIGIYDEITVSGSTALIQSRDKEAISLNLRQNRFKFNTTNFFLDPFDNKDYILKIKGFEVNRLGRVTANGLVCGSTIIEASGNIRATQMSVIGVNGKVESPIIEASTSISTPLLKADKIQMNNDGMIRTPNLQAALIEIDQGGTIKTPSILVNNKYGIDKNGLTTVDILKVKDTEMEEIEVKIPDFSTYSFLTKDEEKEIKIVQEETTEMELETEEVELTDVPIVIQLDEELFLDATIPSITIPALKIRDLIIEGIKTNDDIKREVYHLLGNDMGEEEIEEDVEGEKGDSENEGTEDNE